MGKTEAFADALPTCSSGRVLERLNDDLCLDAAASWTTHSRRGLEGSAAADGRRGWSPTRTSARSGRVPLALQNQIYHHSIQVFASKPISQCRESFPCPTGHHQHHPATRQEAPHCPAPSLHHVTPSRPTSTADALPASSACPDSDAANAARTAKAHRHRVAITAHAASRLGRRCAQSILRHTLPLIVIGHAGPVADGGIKPLVHDALS